MKLYHMILDYSYGLSCKFCNVRVIDPDKKRNQFYLSDRCPKCKKHPDDEKRLLKEAKKNKSR